MFKSGSYKADMTLTPASKSRKAGPNLTVGPVPAGVAWDGEWWLVDFCCGLSVAVCCCSYRLVYATSH